jgi:hypothetical protein
MKALLACAVLAVVSMTGFAQAADPPPGVADRDFGLFGTWKVFEGADSRGEYCWMGEQSGGATSIAFIVSADDPIRVAVLLSRPTGFGAIKPGEEFQLFHTTNNTRHAGEQATVSANPFFAFFAVAADTLKVFAQQVASGEVFDWKVDAPAAGLEAKSVPLEGFPTAVATMGVCLLSLGASF